MRIRSSSSPRRLRPSPFLTLAAVLSLALAGCAGDPDPAPADPSAPESVAADTRGWSLDDYASQPLTWGSCEGFATDGLSLPGLECGRIAVPLNYEDPAAGDASIAVSRAAATGDRVGSLLVNPGGPGASGLSAALVAGRSPVQESFDVIGFDPRGVGASTPAVRCNTAEEFDAERADSDVDTSPAGIAETEAENRAYAERCADRNDPALLTHLTSADVARDMDVIRSVLGDERLNYLGFSYGTRIGYTYAELFPQNVRAMVLDGALDPSADPVSEVIGQAAGFQSVFDAFAADCAAQADCALGPDPAAAIERFRALVDPLVDTPAATAGERELSYDDAITGTQQALYSTQLWEPLRVGLAQLASGRGDVLLELADLYNGRLPDGTYTNTNDAFTAVRCVDDPRITDPEVEGELNTRFREAAPFLDDGRGTGAAPLEACAFWPVPSEAEPAALSIDGLAPTLVLSTTDDPATPYEAGVALAEQLGSSLITVEGNEHTAAFKGNDCVDDAVSDYLVDPTEPPADLVC